MELQGLFVKFGRGIGTSVTPCGNIGIMLVIALGLAIRRLIFLTEVTAAGFIPI